MKIYTNGILTDEMNASGLIPDSEYPLYISSDKVAVHNYLNGIIDEVRIYNKALTQNEIDLLYNENPTIVENQLVIPNNYILFNNYPNPFNPITIISYYIPKVSFVTLKVYDLLGKEVNSIVRALKLPGKYSVYFEASSLPSGVYFYTIQANEFRQTKKCCFCDNFRG